jgi:hypothetical protein
MDFLVITNYLEELFGMVLGILFKRRDYFNELLSFMEHKSHLDIFLLLLVMFLCLIYSLILGSLHVQWTDSLLFTIR